MKRVICDNCGNQTEPDTHGFAPVGSSWLEISFREKWERADYCSTPCAIAAMQKRQLAAERATVTPTTGSDQASTTQSIPLVQ